MFRRLLSLLGVLVALGPSTAAGGDAGRDPSAVFVNGVELGSDVRRAIAERYGLQIPSGAYWYDPACGAWGLDGGPTVGFTLSGLDLGAPLQPDASGGGNGYVTGVFINGREIHPLDYMALSQLVAVRPGMYWVDAAGNAGYEGGPALVNLFLLARRSGASGGYQRATAGGYIGSDGSTSYFFDPETGSSVMTGP